MPNNEQFRSIGSATGEMVGSMGIGVLGAALQHIRQEMAHISDNDLIAEAKKIGVTHIPELNSGTLSPDQKEALFQEILLVNVTLTNS